MDTGTERVKEQLRHYLEVGTSLSSSLAKMSRADLERMVRELADTVPSLGRERVEDALEEARARGLRGATRLVEVVRDEIDDIASRPRRELADLVERAGSCLAALLGKAQPAPHASGPAHEPAPAPADGAQRAPAAKRTPAAKRAPAATKAAPRARRGEQPRRTPPPPTT